MAYSQDSLGTLAAQPGSPKGRATARLYPKPPAQPETARALPDPHGPHVRQRQHAVLTRPVLRSWPSHLEPVSTDMFPRGDNYTPATPTASRAKTGSHESAAQEQTMTLHRRARPPAHRPMTAPSPRGS